MPYPALRILDANANRAREGLRVLEDVARFALNNRELSRGCKAARHELTALVQSLPAAPHSLLESRDTPGDVGTQLPDARDFGQASLVEVVDRAAGRVGEALRCIEEACRVLGEPGAAERAQRLRYECYDLHRQIGLLVPVRAGRQYRLCVLITEALCTQHAWQHVAEQALAGGAECLQLREKSLSDRELLRRAKVMAAMANVAGADVFVNDRADVALLAGAPGVHLGQTDMPVDAVRSLAGDRLLIGASTEHIAQARAAVSQGADLCGVGPMFATTTKDKPHIAGPAYLDEYLTDPITGSVPHLAIGGVTPENSGILASHGCRGVAASASVCSAADPRAVCEAFVAMFTHEKREPAPA